MIEPRRVSRAIVAALLVGTAVVMGSAVALRAQDQPASATVSKDFEQLTLQLQEIDKRKADIRRLESSVERADGDIVPVLRARIDRRWIRMVERAREAVDLVLGLEARGTTVAAERGRVAQVLDEIPGAIRGAIERDRDLFQATKPSGKELTPADESALLSERQHIIDRVLGLYQALRDHTQLMERFGLDASAERERLSDALQEGAETLSVYLELASDQARSLVDRLKMLPDDADLQARLRIAQARIRSVAGWLQSVVKHMDELKLDTASYRRQLVTATGDLGAEILNVNMLRQLTGRAIKNARKWITDHGPNLLTRTVALALVLLSAWVLSRVASRLARRALGGSRIDISQLLRDFLVSSVRRLVLLLGVVIALTQLGVPIGPTLAGLGVAGFIMGFALQDTLSNFAAGLMILVYRPFDIGDVVEAGGVVGTVNGMSLVSTTILTFDNQRIIVPNRMIWGNVIKNITAETIRRVDLQFGISYGDDVSKAEAILRDIVATHEKVLRHPEPVVRLHTLGDSSVNFVVRPWTRSVDYWDVYWDVTREVKLRFDREGISIPFPQRHVHLHTEPAPGK